MNQELYLLWDPKFGWGVYTKVTCPDPGDFPDWSYRKYEFSVDKWNLVFDRLLKAKDKLEKGKIRPTKDNFEINFPTLENLLK